MALTMDSRGRFTEKLRAEFDVYDSVVDVDVSTSHAELCTRVRAQMESHIADALAERTLNLMAGRIGVKQVRMLEFFEFLLSDPETVDRFIAHTAAKRISR